MRWEGNSEGREKVLQRQEEAHKVEPKLDLG